MGIGLVAEGVSTPHFRACGTKARTAESRDPGLQNLGNLPLTVSIEMSIVVACDCVWPYCVMCVKDPKLVVVLYWLNSSSALEILDARWSRLTCCLNKHTTEHSCCSETIKAEEHYSRPMVLLLCL